MIVDSFGSRPSRDLHVFDQQWGFPDPDLQVMKFGNVCRSTQDWTMVGWAQETTSTWSTRTPSRPARRCLAETAVAEVEGTSGLRR